VTDAEKTVHEVRVAVTRHMTFRIEKAKDAFSAIYQAEVNVWEGDSPDDEDLPSLEVKSVTVDDREIELSYSYDWDAPLVRGLHQQVTTAYVDGKRITENLSFKSAVEVAEAFVQGGGPDAA
jgi:hypothetical protein